jgi:hypothetical protein
LAAVQAVMGVFDSVEEIVMFAGYLRETVRWYESEWRFRRDSGCEGKCGRPTLQRRLNGAEETKKYWRKCLILAHQNHVDVNAV